MASAARHGAGAAAPATRQVLQASSRLLLANVAPAFDLEIKRQAGRHRLILLRTTETEACEQGLRLRAGAVLHYELEPSTWAGETARTALSLAVPGEPGQGWLLGRLAGAVESPADAGQAPVSLALAQLVYCFPDQQWNVISVTRATGCSAHRLRARLFREGAALSTIVNRQRAMHMLFAPATESLREIAWRIGLETIDTVETLFHDTFGISFSTLRRAAAPSQFFHALYRKTS
jgi:AraC-like DNA-binding protein